MKRLAPYRKAVVAVLGGALTTALATLPPETTAYQVLVAVSAILTAAGVYGVKNEK